MADTCRCGKPATHQYSRLKVCGKCYQAHARHDDGPGRVPKNYDWKPEMDARRLK